jgi:hypothetical protein
MRRTLVVSALVALPALVHATPPEVDSAADTQLQRMSTYLTSLKTFRVRSNAVDEVVTKTGQKLQYLSDSRLSIKRPNLVRSDRIGAAADVVLRYDGKTISVFGKNTGYYATSPAPAALDEALEVARAKLGLELPGGDLIVEDPYATLMTDVRSLRYIGVEPVDGVACHHLALQGKDVDAQLWIEAGPQPLPRRYVITSKTVAGSPQFTVALSKWEVNVSLPDALFRFDPPPGARRIKFHQAKEPVSIR